MRIPVCVLRNHKPRPPPLATDRPAAKQKTAKFAVEAVEAALHFVRLLRNSKLPDMATEFVAGRLEESQPAILSPKLALELGRMVQPALIEEVCGALWTTGPYQRRNGVDDKANVLPRQLRALRRISTDKR
jgi:hypothetical protein